MLNHEILNNTSNSIIVILLFGKICIRLIRYFYYSLLHIFHFYIASRTVYNVH